MAIALVFMFITTISSSMIAPASERVAAQFGATNTVVIAFVTSIFVLGFGMCEVPSSSL